MSNINGLSGLQSTSMAEYLQNTQSQSAAALEKKLGTDYSTATEEELMDVCKDFEAYFVEQLIKAMQSTLDEESDPLSGSYSYFKDMQTQEYAKRMTEQTDFGIAQTLYEQMKRNYGL